MPPPEAATKSPASLYSLAVRRVVLAFDSFDRATICRQLTESMRFDIYWEMFCDSINNVDDVAKLKRFQCLQSELAKLDVFLALLRVGHRRVDLHEMFEGVNECTLQQQSEEAEVELLADHLSSKMGHELRRVPYMEVTNKMLDTALNFASFLIDGSWYVAAQSVLVSIVMVNEGDEKKLRSKRLDVECHTKLLHTVSSYCLFPLAESAFDHLKKAIAQGNCTGINLAGPYSEFSSYCFVRSQYQDAFEWSLKAVKLLHNDLPPKVIVDTLRQASKASVVRRQFAKAEILIQEAVLLAREIYGECHPKYADCLVDYGFYLLNVDGVAKSVQAYETALKVREKCFGPNNLHVAIGHEELAYASYVFEYNTGRFDVAKRHAEKSLTIMARVVPANHLLLASSQRVLALILEEIAIDHVDKDYSKEILSRAEHLHLSALKLTIGAFGEMNVQTAKQYGNLGRLYQTMEKYTEAENMHLNAIRIKESLLGRDDYEVALSIGHLASLYNYDLAQYDKAERLYLRSIDIGVKLFGPSYSGLEYDYRGLIRVYHERQDLNNYLTYAHKLRDWKDLRDAREGEHNPQTPLLSGGKNPQTILQIIQAVTKSDNNENNTRDRFPSETSSSTSAMSL